MPKSTRTRTADRATSARTKPGTITFRADPDLVAAVKLRAAEEDRSESSVVRTAVRAFLDVPNPAALALAEEGR
jgi:predicted transcriptional regulator